MEEFLNFNVIKTNSTLDWDETKYNIFYTLYNIESDENHTISFVHEMRQHNNGQNLSYLLQTNKTQDELYMEHMENQFKFYIEGIAVVVIAILGIIGNLISGYILTRKSMRSSINILLLGLAVADTIFIFGNIIILGLPTILSHLEINFSIISLLTPYLFPIDTMGHLASVYFTIAVTVERYVAVCHPFHARSQFTRRQAIYIAIGIAIFSFGFNFVRWWEYTCIAVVDNDNNVIRYIPITTSLRRNPIYEQYFVYLSYLVLGFSLPLISLIVFNYLIYRKIKKANKERRLLSSSELNENQLALMLVMVVLVYILCNSLILVNVVAKVITGTPSIIGIDQLRNFGLTFNSSVNFIIYCSYGERFREIFMGMCPESIRRAYYSRRHQRVSRISRTSSTDKGRPLSGISIIASTPIITDSSAQITSKC